MDQTREEIEELLNTSGLTLKIVSKGITQLVGTVEGFQTSGFPPNDVLVRINELSDPSTSHTIVISDIISVEEYIPTPEEENVKFLLLKDDPTRVWTFLLTSGESVEARLKSYLMNTYSEMLTLSLEPTGDDDPYEVPWNQILKIRPSSLEQSPE